MVELMMSLALFMVAVLGVISMQKVTLLANGHAKNLASAQRIAQAWAGQLEMDASAWRTAALPGFLNDTRVWQRPTYIAARSFGAAFDALGNPLSDSSTDLAKATFCTHVRMSWLYPLTLPVTGNGVLRAEIRVFWLRDGETPLSPSASMCSLQTPAQAASIGIAPTSNSYQFVYQTVGVRQHFP
jgi:hypothetical protein